MEPSSLPGYSGHLEGEPVNGNVPSLPTFLPSSLLLKYVILLKHENVYKLHVNTILKDRKKFIICVVLT